MRPSPRAWSPACAAPTSWPSLPSSQAACARPSARPWNSWGDALGIPLSTGGPSDVEVRVAAALSRPYQEAEDFVRRQKAVHLDETGWRERRLRAWLWARVTQKVAVFRLARARSKAEAKAQLGEGFLGTAVTDRFAGYM
ncbi:MAG: transposase [Myxococcaceae bacterium]|nr:transposase [Myxococcaceae bacterium]